MADLAKLVNRDGFDLLASLQAHFQSWLKSPHHKSLFDAHLVIVLIMPKSREPGGSVQSRETWAYLCNHAIGRVGENLGAWQRSGKDYGLVLAGPPPANAGQPCALFALRTTLTMSADAAAIMNGLEKRAARRVTAIGVGALGSQVVLNLARAGWGSWTMIDNDITFPHNLARHALAGSSLGHPKAHCVAAMVNSLTDGEPVATSIVADVIRPGTNEAAVNKALTEAEVILDGSASIAVSRHLALDVQGPARRLSIFLSPSGRDAVLLAEDAGRTARLDLLEMQYYRHVASEQDLADHLRQPAENRRYANSCRDTSVTMPQDLVALHAATCSRGIKAALSSGDALIAVWKANERDLSVRCLRFPPSPPVVHRFGNWTLITDASLIDKIHAARAKRLPAETGGVLIGYHDMMRKIVYVADTILSPPDSVEWPTVYIRGCRDLPAAVKELSEKSGGNLGYVGEWHSHPDGCSCRPSGLDIKAFAWLTVEMSDGGHPALMAIAGDKGATAFFLGQMAPDHDDLEARTAR